MQRRLTLVGLLAISACGGGTDVPVDAVPEPPDYEAVSFERVGHANLDADTNTALAVTNTHAYVAHRRDGEIDIVDISNPEAPVRVGGFDAGWDPLDIRAVADLQRLYVLTPMPAGLAVYDISTPTAPVRLGGFEVSQMFGHEFFLWRDPAAPSRVLAVISDVGLGGFAVLDVSDGAAITLRYRQTTEKVHAVSLTDDGSRMYVSHISGDVAIMDSTMLVTTGTPQPAFELGSRTIADCAITSFTCIAHSTVKVPGRAIAVTTSENTMCPKGGMDIVDLSDETMPMRLGTWQHPKANVCGTAEPALGAFGYGAHQPTVTANLALVSWYRAGLLAFDIADPTAPVEVGSFYQKVLPGSRDEWGAVASVSYPVIKDGLIYILDGRNGLDILRYTGPHAAEVETAGFLEGNSNL